jgi:predicted RNA binding protein YcfA (HicA-like mRNA interferase family)
MKLPRDISGGELARKLEKYQYQVIRQTGSHLRLTSNIKGTESHITIPRHSPLKIGILNGVLSEVAAYLKIEKKILIAELFRA